MAKQQKKKLLSKYELVHIYWHDAAMHGTAQISITEAKQYSIIRGHSTGWLINEDKEHVTIATDFFPASNQNAQDSFRTLQSYPKSGISKIDRLKTLEIYEEPSHAKN